MGRGALRWSRSPYGCRHPVGGRYKCEIKFLYLLPRIRELGHTDAVVVLTTLANTDEAVKFVRALLDRRLVACGTILPAARSLYRWQDKLGDETEVVVMLKTRSGAIHGLEKAFKELHPYKVPELLAVPVTGGLERYLGWINSETSLQIV